MTENIFNRLLRYRPRENRSPEEDFFTEAFVGVLEHEPQILNALFHHLTEQHVESVEIRTQVAFLNLDGATDRPDILLVGYTKEKAKQHCLLIESKLESGEGDKQLDRYKTVLRTKIVADTKTLAYITKYPDAKYTDQRELIEDGNILFRPLRWGDIYRFIRVESRKTQPRTMLINELLKFMEVLQMTTEIKLTDLVSGVVYAQAIHRYWALLQKAWVSSGLKKLFDSKTAGNWVTTPISEGDVNWWSPPFKNSKIQLTYGIHFNIGDPGRMDLGRGRDGENKELPILFVALFCGQDSDRDEAQQTYSEYFSELSTRGWNADCPQPKNYLIKKEDFLNMLNTSSLDEELERRLVSLLADLRDAPFE